MVATARESEREYLLKLAEDYRGKDYQIVFQPPLDELPDFLREYKPDMLALGNHESVVIEVKARPLLEGDSDYLKSLAQAIEIHPGWRFELVVLAPDQAEDEFELTDFSPYRGNLRVQEIKPGLQIAKELAASQPESALLYAWSLVEAILRHLAKSEEISLKTFEALYLIKTLVAEGIISRSDYQSLIDTLPLRNAIAHGFKVDSLTANAVYELVNLGEKLLSLLASDEEVN
jgi:uncharacterized protein YutE (UPF0331/DUF86 family)